MTGNQGIRQAGAGGLKREPSQNLELIYRLLANIIHRQDRQINLLNQIDPIVKNICILEELHIDILVQLPRKIERQSTSLGSVLDQIVAARDNSESYLRPGRRRHCRQQGDKNNYHQDFYRKACAWRITHSQFFS
ncbi:hypothetical protein [Desulfuromonas sp. DDH964]|uniref:hypothetical protein n=1 Tax=Desulfuromonas sp. DDH964 TaxID=1823759 RepID=UPI00083618FF|nr:hypothetical protein [Desulfuromonas sp. DDH964]